MDFKTEQVDISRLKPHPKNYQTHPQDQIAHIIESIKEHGIYRNIVVAKDFTILAGHGVVEACKQMELKSVPVIRLDIRPDDVRALKVLAGDNEIEHLAIVDDRALSEILKEIKEMDVDGLLGTGYDEMMLANLVMVTRPQNEIEDFDEAAHWAGMPEYDEGSKSLKIIVNFDEEKERQKFMQKIGASVVNKKTGDVWSIWWPERERKDLKSVRFKG